MNLTNQDANLYKRIMILEKPSHLLRNCVFKYKCKQTWESLEEAKGFNYNLIRYCPKCKENVYLAESDNQIIMFVETCSCIAIPIENSRLDRMQRRHLVGVPKLVKS